MKLCKCFFLFCMTMLLCLTSSVQAQDAVMFNYQGRIKVQGQPFDGTGQFKFALVNQTGSITYWSNDGTSVDGGEPTASMSIPVTEGVFSVMIGDPDLSMEALNASLFNTNNPIFIRVWFNDGTLGFEQLNPDRRIVNPNLIGTDSGNDDYTIYVDSALGDDENSGLEASAPKATIQAAIDSLPVRVDCNITIDVADGVYREEVFIYGITVSPDATLNILGDVAWTRASGSDPAVRLTGIDDDTAGTKVRRYGFNMRNCHNIVIQGFYVDGYTSVGVFVQGGRVYLKNGKFENNYNGVYAVNNCSIVLEELLSCNNSKQGFLIVNQSTGSINNIDGVDNDEFGLYISGNSAGSFYGTCNFTGNGLSGLGIIHMSRAWFSGTYTGHCDNNTQYGIDCRYASYSEDRYKNTLTGNGYSAYRYDNGAVDYN